MQPSGGRVAATGVGGPDHGAGLLAGASGHGAAVRDTGREWRRLLVAVVVVFAVERAVFLAIAAFLRVPREWWRWDAPRYLEIARHGYIAPLPTNRHDLPDVVFFPLYPALGRLVHMAGVPLPAALRLVGVVASLCAMLGIAACGAELERRRTGVLMAALWGAAPRAFLTLMPYTESLFTALAAWCLLALLRRRWWRAGLLCCLAGLTRSTAVPLLATMALVWGLDRRRPVPSGMNTTHTVVTPPRDALRGLLSLVLAGVGLAAYVAWVAHTTHHWNGYVLAQRRWHMGMGAPWTMVHDMRRWWSTSFPEWWAIRWVIVVVLAYLALTLLMLVLRVRPEFSLYAVCSWLWTAAAQNYLWSKARFLLPDFTVWFLPARWLARRPAWVGIVAIAALLVLDSWVDAHSWGGRTSP